MQHSIQDERNILLRPHTGQFVIDELPLMFVCMAGLVYGGMEGLPLSSMARIVSLFLLLVLLYRFIYLRRIRYRVGEEQLVSEHGISYAGWTTWNCTVSWTFKNTRASCNRFAG